MGRELLELSPGLEMLHFLHSSSTLIASVGTQSRHSSQLVKAAPECHRALAHTSYSHPPKASLAQHALGSPAHAHPSSSYLAKADPSGHTLESQAYTFSNSSHPTKAAPMQHALGPLPWFTPIPSPARQICPEHAVYMGDVPTQYHAFKTGRGR